MSKKKILIVGTGFSGSTIARLLAETGHEVNIIDKRNHIAGNAYDYENELGIRIHKYGPHIFHTNNNTVVDFLIQEDLEFLYLEVKQLHFRHAALLLLCVCMLSNR